MSKNDLCWEMHLSENYWQNYFLKKMLDVSKIAVYSTGNYMSKFNNKNNRTRYVNFENLVLVFLLLTLSM